MDFTLYIRTMLPKYLSKNPNQTANTTKTLSTTKQTVSKSSPHIPVSNVPVLNIAVILAGGQGYRASRNSSNFSNSSNSYQNKSENLNTVKQLPKQFWPLNHIPLWQHSWQRYAAHPQIDKICLVWPQAYLTQIRKEIATLPSPTGGCKTYVIAGGPERSDSSFLAVDFCRQWQRAPLRIQILIHDAARPLFSKQLIDQTLNQLQYNNAVVCALPVHDSLFYKTGSTVQAIADRFSIMRSQTPQGFELQTIQRALAMHQQKQEITASDDISVVKHYLPEVEISIVAGEPSNMKLTEAADLEILETYYSIQTKINR